MGKPSRLGLNDYPVHMRRGEVIGLSVCLSVVVVVVNTKITKSITVKSKVSSACD